MKHAAADALAPPPAARELFGDHLERGRRYAQLLATTGIEHGLIGPREAPRLWDRHLLNCAVLERLLPHRASVIDIGSGAGLPGIVLALLRPDLQVHLVEPLQRRTVWLESTVSALELDRVRVHRARAQELVGLLRAPYVTARAVASLTDLAAWGMPLLEPGGTFLAVKGAGAQDELTAAHSLLAGYGVRESRLVVLGGEVLATPTRVIEMVRDGGTDGRPGRSARETS